jgi:replication factor A1
MPIKDVIARINEDTGLSEAEINDLFKKKLKKLEGLVSEEGAAYIVASELGVRLFKDLGSGAVKIGKILSGMRTLECVGKVVRAYPLVTFERKDKTQGKVASVLIGDETGKIRIVLWDKRAELVDTGKIKEGDIVKVRDAYSKESNLGGPEVHLGRMSNLIINPEGVEVNVDEFAAANIKKIKDLEVGDQARVLGIIVQAFNPIYYNICNDCGKKVEEDGNVYVCKEHGEIEASKAMVLSLILDDGEEHIRCVTFRGTAEKLAGITAIEAQRLIEKGEEQIISEKIENNLLGKAVEVEGRVNENKVFERKEMLLNRIMDPNPKVIAQKLTRGAQYG